MYVILVNEDNTLSAPKKERIIQRSKLVDTLWVLVHPLYKGIDMSGATVMMEYILPVSKKYRTEILVPSSEMYEDHLKYMLPFDTKLTDEAGDIEIQLSFIYVDLDITGKPVQRVRKIAPAHKITIVPISAWSDIIPDSALSAIDQRIIKVDAQIRALEELNKIQDEAQVDNLKYDEDSNMLQLMAGENAIGDVVRLKNCTGNHNADGIPVVDFGNSTDDSDDIEIPESESNVVEF